MTTTKALNQTRFLVAEQVRNHWYAKVPDDTLLEDVLTPGFWRHNLAGRRVGDLIEIVRENYSMDVLCRVIKIDAGMMFLRVIHKYVDNSGIENAPVEADNEERLTPPEDYKIKHLPNGKVKGYAVFRKDLADPVRTGAKSYNEAVKLAEAHKAASEATAAA